MDDLAPGDLKSILHSKRANIYYLEHCRVLFQQARLQRIYQQWTGNRTLRDAGFAIDSGALKSVLEASSHRVATALDNTALLTEETRLTKHLFKLAAVASQYGDFARAKRGSGGDPANQFLDHGNYLAYGLGATATWVLGVRGAGPAPTISRCLGT